jgi:DNA-binding NtrC family response regulator
MDCVQRASERLAVLRWDLVVVDIEGMPDAVESCLRLLEGLRRTPPPAVPLLIMAGTAQLEAVSGLLSCGAADYLTKPFSPERLLERVWVALASMRGQTEQHSSCQPARRSLKNEPVLESAGARGSLPVALPAGLIIGRSAAIRRVVEQVQLVASKRTTVLITGETGTGKERVARAIHALSRRQGLPMVSVNCGGIPANLLEDEF